MLRQTNNLLPDPHAGRPVLAGAAPLAVADVGLFQILWRQRWMLLVTLLLVVGGACLHLRAQTRIYASASRVYVEQSGGPRIITDNSGQPSGGSNYLLTQCELLKSTPILSIPFESPELRRMKTFNGIDNPVAYLKSITDASIGKNSDIITVTVESPYPQEAAVLVNRVVDAYITYQSKVKRSSAAEVLQILQKEKDKREAEFQVKLDKAMKYRQDNGIFSQENERGNVINERLGKLSEALTSTQIEALEARTDFENAQSMIQDPAKIKQLLVEALASKGAAMQSTDPSGGQATLRAEIARHEETLENLKRQFLPNHPAVRTAQARLDRAQERLAFLAPMEEGNLAQTYLGVLQRRYEKAHQRELELQKGFAAQEKLALAANTKSAAYALLDGDLKRTEKLCDMLDSRIKELNVTQDVGALNISVLEVGRPGESPVKPEVGMFLLKAILAGLVGGLGLAFLRDWKDQRLRSAEEIVSILGVSILGIVPRILGAQAGRDFGRKVQLAPRSRIAEAYRTIRTAVYFGVADPEAKTLLVTSPLAGEGKSTTTSNLAISMAQAGQRTLVVDCDFRKPTQAGIFEVDTEVGLIGVLAGRAPLDAAIVPTGIDRLDVLPCGPIPSNPSEIINSRPFADLLSALASKYDHVLIDCPPLLPVTDARILAGMADVTILVLRADKSTRKAGKAAAGILLGVRARLLGVVVNDLTKEEEAYSYYSGYYGHRQSAHIDTGAPLKIIPNESDPNTLAVTRGNRD